MRRVSLPLSLPFPINVEYKLFVIFLIIADMPSLYHIWCLLWQLIHVHHDKVSIHLLRTLRCPSDLCRELLGEATQTRD
jgi:hypothetical protein